MGLVYALNASDYEPISYGDNYLYQQYDKLASFLLKNYGVEYKQILSKPVLNNGIVNWHADYNFELSRIGDLNKQTQLNIKKQYWELKNRLDNDIDTLEHSQLPEKKKWGAMLRQVFDDENNVILTDGNFWCLLWGWKFKNKSENYLAPEFINPIQPEPEAIADEVESEEKIVSENSEEDSVYVEPIETIENTTLEQEPINVTNNDNFEPVAKTKVSFWYKLKRFFRNFVYRYWGLLFFILLVLFIFCILQKCTKQNCNEVEELNRNLDSLNTEIENRCQ